MKRMEMIYYLIALIAIVTLDFQGNVVSVIQVIALILLVIGVYPYRIRTRNRNLIIHGFLSITATGLNLATVLYIMIPAFSEDFISIGQSTFVQLAVIWSHAVLGVVAIVLGLVIIFSWITHPLAELGCTKTWRLMIPTFVIWAFALVLGLVIHIFNIM
jgi:hypothetical protein